MMTDPNTSIDTLLKSKNAVNDMENTWIQRFKLEQSCVDELWIQNWSGLNPDNT